LSTAEICLQHLTI